MTRTDPDAIRRAHHMTLIDDEEGRCYRVTADVGYCFELPDEDGQSGLHELISDYWNYTKAEALGNARREFNVQIELVEKCRANCEWCEIAMVSQ